MLRSQISSSIDELTLLSNQYQWIPNEYTIRPSDDVLQTKRQIMLHISEQWLSLKDFILHSVFRLPISFNEDEKLSVITYTTPSEWIFDPCLFPYNIPKGQHYILWNSKYDYSAEFDPSIIDTMLTKKLRLKLGHDNFDFAWYKNPKPSVLEFYHVQVFWIENQ